jgi:phosphate acetyltransferase
LHDSQVAGRANVLIFPDLNSGNIASKLVQLVGRANAYGQILLGLNRPAADVSRGSNAHDILGVAPSSACSPPIIKNFIRARTRNCRGE